jgi:hypothetical protein
MRKFLVLITVIFLYLIYGFYLGRYDVAVTSEDLVADHPKGFFDYRGVTHVRGADQNTMIESAQSVGLDYLSLTELNIYDKSNLLSGYHGNLLLMVDGEYSYLNSRLLNIGATSTTYLQGVGRSQVLFADLLSRPQRDPELGLFVLARPVSGKYRWSGDYPPGLDGLEIINLSDVWQQAWQQKKWSFFLSLLIFPFNEKLALLRLFQPPDEQLHLWDELAQRQRVVGIAGTGSEGKLRYPSYETLFSLVRDHVLMRSELTGNTAGDLEKIASALRLGQFYMCLDILGNPKGFNAVIRSKEGQIYTMGSEIPFHEGLSLEINLPQKPKVPFDTIIYRNGERMMTSNSQVTQYFVNTPGVYRVQVRVIPTLPLPDGKKWIPWIYTNMFFVQPQGKSKGGGMQTTKSPKAGN